jgi:uncharacterized membrane protein
LWAATFADEPRAIMPVDVHVVQYLVSPIEGLLAGWAVMRHMTRRAPLHERITGISAERVLIALIATATAVMGAMVAARYLTWHSFVFDLGSYDQKAWLVAAQPTLDGMLEQTYKGGVRLSPCGLPRLWGVCHFQPTFLIFGFLYRAWDSSLLLLGCQVLFVVSGVIPIYLLARDQLGSAAAGATCAALYLLYPAVQYNGVLDFRPDHIAIPALLWGYVLANRGRHVAALGIVGLAGLGKDTLFLAFAFFGLYLALRHRQRVLGGMAFAVGLTVFAYVRLHLLNFNGVSEGQISLIRDFPELAGLLSGSASLMFGSVFGAVRTLFQPHKLLYLVALFVPVALLPFRALPELLPAVPSLAFSLLSVNSEHASVQSQYSASVVGPAFAALIVAVANLGSKSGRGRDPVPVLTGLAVLSAFVSFGLGPTPISLNFWSRDLGGRWHFTQYLPDRQHVLERAASLVPTDPRAVVVTQNDVNDRRLAHRLEFLAFPNALDRADYVLLDTWRQPYVYWMNDPKTYRVLVDRLRVNPAYRLIFEEQGVLLFERRRTASVWLHNSPAVRP